MNIKALTFLKIFGIINNISNYFWHLHVKEVRKSQIREVNEFSKITK